MKDYKEVVGIDVSKKTIDAFLLGFDLGILIWFVACFKQLI
jgi:hypothetical protein